MERDHGLPFMADGNQRKLAVEVHSTFAHLTNTRKYLSPRNKMQDCAAMFLIQ